MTATTIITQHLATLAALRVQVAAGTLTLPQIAAAIEEWRLAVAGSGIRTRWKKLKLSGNVPVTLLLDELDTYKKTIESKLMD